MKMKLNYWNTIKNSTILFCVLFSATTLVSSTLQLLRGQMTDTNTHIINRAAVVLIAVITITLFDKLRFKSTVLSHVVAYIFSMSTVFLYVWIMGFFEELHPNAYRDIFLNFTVITIIFSTITTLIDSIKIKNKLKEK